MAIEQLVIAVVIMAGVTVLTRALPFLLYKKWNPPKIILFVQRYIPPMVMLILVLYALGDVSWGSPPHGLPELAAAALTAGLHLWRRNALISIFSGTGLYMVLIQTDLMAGFFTG